MLGNRRAAGAVCVGVGLATAVLAAALVAAHGRRGQDDVVAALAERARAARDWLDELGAIADQVARRPKIRERLELREHGMEDVALAADTRAELESALRLSTALAGISRHDGQGRVVAQAGQPVPHSPWPVSERLLSKAPDRTVLRLGTRSYVAVSAPILGWRGGRIGTDVLLFEIEALAAVVGADSTISGAGPAIVGQNERGRWWNLFAPTTGDASNAVTEGSALAQALAAGAESGGAQRTGAVRGAGGVRAAYAAIEGSPWVLAAPIDAGRLRSEALRSVLLPALAALVLGLLAGWGIGRRA